MSIIVSKVASIMPILAVVECFIKYMRVIVYLPCNDLTAVLRASLRVHGAMGLGTGAQTGHS